MKILSIECTASPASVCIYENGKIIANSFVNVKLTHSQTLMPMIESTLKSALLSIKDIDGISVAAGPGSFTGVRIGISAVKGLAVADNLPCVAVSALLSMASMFMSENAIICPVMDARCNQYYNALFCIKDGKIERLCNDRAILCEDLIGEISKLKDKIIICGDGADKFYADIQDKENTVLADTQRKYQNAIGVAIASVGDFINGNTVTAEELLPMYLRLPQAERELKSKQNIKDV